MKEIGILAAELMESLPDDCEVGIVAVVAELSSTRDGETVTEIRYRCSDPRRWVQAGLFRTSVRIAERAGAASPVDDEDDEDDE